MPELIPLAGVMDAVRGIRTVGNVRVRETELEGLEGQRAITLMLDKKGGTFQWLDDDFFRLLGMDPNHVVVSWQVEEKFGESTFTFTRVYDPHPQEHGGNGIIIDASPDQIHEVSSYFPIIGQSNVLTPSMGGSKMRDVPVGMKVYVIEKPVLGTLPVGVLSRRSRLDRLPGFFRETARLAGWIPQR